MSRLRDSNTKRPHERNSRFRRGFTLVELLVVVGLILLLAAISATAINLTVNADKVQSYLAGARDRAIYAKAQRGVRFLLDPTNNRTVSSMVYIQQTDPWTQGTIQLERDPTDTTAAKLAWIVRGFDNETGYPYPTHWQDLYDQGLLTEGSRIKIPNTPDGTWYRISPQLLTSASAPGSGGPNPPKLALTTPFETAPTNPDTSSLDAFLGNGPKTYLLELPPSVIPNSDVTVLPKGTVIHLDRCTSASFVDLKPAQRGDRLPFSWKHFPSVTQTFTGAPDPSTFDYTSTLDLMFTPRGTITGTAAQRGLIHLYVGEQKDADYDRLVPWASNGTSPSEYGAASNGYERGDKIVVSVFTRTGTISVHPVFSNSDPFKFAETGEVAGK